MKFEQDILKAQIASQLSQEASIEGTDINILIKSFEENLIGSYDRDMFMKSWSGDLQKKFPSGGWKNVNGAAVFINGGKVVAGLVGFNGMIDDYFSAKKEKEGGENQPKEEEKKDKPVNERTQQEIHEAKQKIADTMPKPINKMIWEEFKPYGIEMAKQSAHSQPESYYERMAKHEHDWAVKNDKSQYDTSKQKSISLNDLSKMESDSKKMSVDELKSKIDEVSKIAESKETSDKDRVDFMLTESKLMKELANKLKKGEKSEGDKTVTIDTFKEIAKKAKDPKDFIEQTKKITNVPPEVAKEFFDKYADGGKLSQEQSAKKFMEEVNGGANKIDSKISWDTANEYIQTIIHNKKKSQSDTLNDKDIDSILKKGAKLLSSKNVFVNPMAENIDFETLKDKFFQDKIETLKRNGRKSGDSVKGYQYAFGIDGDVLQREFNKRV